MSADRSPCRLSQPSLGASMGLGGAGRPVVSAAWPSRGAARCDESRCADLREHLLEERSRMWVRGGGPKARGERGRLDQRLATKRGGLFLHLVSKRWGMTPARWTGQELRRKGRFGRKVREETYILLARKINRFSRGYTTR